MKSQPFYLDFNLSNRHSDDIVRIFRAANANSNVSIYVRVNVTVNPVFANVCLFVYTEYSFRLININNFRRTVNNFTL